LIERIGVQIQHDMVFVKTLSLSKGPTLLFRGR